MELPTDFLSLGGGFVKLLLNSLFFYRKISTTMIYKLMKHVCIFNRIIEFMIIIINVFSVMILC